MSNITSSVDNGFPRAAERWIGFTWVLLCVILNFLGNTTILVSLASPLMKLEKVTAFILKNIAICDILYGVVLGVPLITSYAVGDWVFGDSLCFISGILLHPLFVANISMVLALGFNKLAMVVTPFLVRTRSCLKTCIGVMGGCWGPALLLSLFQLIVPSRTKFSSTLLTCKIYITHDTFRNIWRMVFKWLVIPTLIGVILSIFALIYIAKRQVKYGLNRSGTRATLFVALIFMIMFTPTIGLLILGKAIIANYTLIRIATALTIANSCHNFFTYFYTLRSFKRFFYDKILRFKGIHQHQSSTIKAKRSQQSVAVNPADKQDNKTVIKDLDIKEVQKTYFCETKGSVARAEEDCVEQNNIVLLELE